MPTNVRWGFTTRSRGKHRTGCECCPSLRSDPQLLSKLRGELPEAVALQRERTATICFDLADQHKRARKFDRVSRPCAKAELPRCACAVTRVALRWPRPAGTVVPSSSAPLLLLWT